MKDFYKIVLDKSKPNDGMVEGNILDIRQGFIEAGYKEYCFGGFQYVYTKNALSEEEKAKYEKEAQEALSSGVKQIAKEINKRILDDILKIKYETVDYTPFPDTIKYDTQEFEEFCIHEQHLYNQGYRMCDINGPIDDCENCKLREPKKYTVTMSSASTIK